MFVPAAANSEWATNHCSCAAFNLPCTGLCCCTNCKNKDSQERVDINEVFNDDGDFGEYLDGGTDGEADNSSDSSEDELFEDDEIDSDKSKTTTEVDFATDTDLPYRTSSVLHT